MVHGTVRKLGLGLLVSLGLLFLLEGSARLLQLGGRSALVRLEEVDDAESPGMARIRALGISADIDHLSAPFPKEHDDDAYRVVLFGESAAAGFPFAPRSTPAKWLALRLEKRRPDVRFEIVDTSIPGLHSDFFPPIARLAFDPPPDLVILYVGNNEFLMSFLALESARGPADSVAERLAEFSTGFRWLRAALAPTKRDLHNPRNPLSTEVYFDEPLGPLRERVHERFERNLRIVIRLARAAGADVFVVRPVAALRNAVPKSSVFAAGIEPEEKARFAALLDEARALARAGDGAGADQRLAEAARIDESVAILHYRIGERREDEGRTAEAREAYGRALELDERPVRVNARTAAVLERLAVAVGAPWVDAQAAFAAESDDGMIGDDLVLDHVHFTVAGQRLLAGLLIDAMIEHGLPDGVGGKGAWREDDVSLDEGVAILGLDPQTVLHPEAQIGFYSVLLALDSSDPSDHLERARRRFDRVLSRRPDDPLAMTGQALLIMVEGRVDEALAAFDTLHERSPAMIGTLGSMLGTHAALRAAFDRAGLELRQGRIERRVSGD